MTKADDDMVRIARRRLMLVLLGTNLLAPLGACGRGSRQMDKNGVVLSVVMYSYLNRTIIDVHFNDDDIGVSGAYGSTGIVTGVHIPFGPQRLNWRLDGPKGTPGNGDTVNVKNPLVVDAKQILPTTRYVGLHIYPDFTAEIMLCDDMPDVSPRGEKILQKRYPHAR